MYSVFNYYALLKCQFCSCILNYGGFIVVIQLKFVISVVNFDKDDISKNSLGIVPVSMFELTSNVCRPVTTGLLSSKSTSNVPERVFWLKSTIFKDEICINPAGSPPERLFSFRIITSSFLKFDKQEGICPEKTLWPKLSSSR